VEFELAFQDLFGRAYRVAYGILGSGPVAEDVAAEALTRAFADWKRVGHLPYREQIKARNEPTATGPVVRGRGVRVEVVSVDLERERALLRLS
jgi:hypothetical protein